MRRFWSNKDVECNFRASISTRKNKNHYRYISFFVSLRIQNTVIKYLYLRLHQNVKYHYYSRDFNNYYFDFNKTQFVINTIISYYHFYIYRIFKNALYLYIFTIFERILIRSVIIIIVLIFINKNVFVNFYLLSFFFLFYT